MRSGRGERHADAGAILDSLADVDDAAFKLGLGPHVGEEKALAADDDGFESEEAAFVVGVERFGFFVERLLFDVEAVNEERCAMGMAKIRAAVGFIGAARDGARPLTFGLFQSVPDAAHAKLPSGGFRRWSTIKGRGAGAEKSGARVFVSVTGTREPFFLPARVTGGEAPTRIEGGCVNE